MKDGTYITIQSWMRTELDLKGNDLIVYAIIFGFSQTENQRFTGNLQYLADWCGATKQGILKNIKNLLDRGLIEKNEEVKNNIKFVEYYVTKFNTPLNKVAYPIKQSLTNNIYNNKDNKSISKEILQPAGCFKLSSKKPIVKKPNLFTKCSDLIDSYTKNPALHESLVNYLRVRLEMKDKPLYFNSWKGLLNKLDREFAEDEKVAVVNQSIERGYASFFPLMKSGAGSKLKESGSRHVKSFTEEDYERETEFHEECSKKGLPTQF